MKESCDITVILDRSGSMEIIRTDTIGGFNSFLKDQKALPGEATISLVQFNGHSETMYSGVSVKLVADLSMDTFVPLGNTALLDTIGKTIDATGNRLRSLKESERPNKVVFVIITDGEENSSKLYSKKQIKDMIQSQTSNYNWQFMYIGANVDAFGVASSIGINLSNTMNYAASSEGSAHCHSVYSSTISDFRSGLIKTTGISPEAIAKSQEIIDNAKVN